MRTSELIWHAHILVMMRLLSLIMLFFHFGERVQLSQQVGFYQLFFFCDLGVNVIRKLLRTLLPHSIPILNLNVIFEGIIQVTEFSTFIQFLHRIFQNGLCLILDFLNVVFFFYFITLRINPYLFVVASSHPARSLTSG